MRASLRKQLTLAFAGLATVPLLLVGAILAWQGFTTQERQALDMQREVARRVSSHIEAFLGGLVTELRLVSQVQGLPALNPQRQRDVLAGLLAYEEAFESLALLDSRGGVAVRLARASVSTVRPGAPTETEDFFPSMSGGLTYFGPVRFHETSGEPFLTVAVPLQDIRSGEMDGALVAELRLERIRDLIRNLQIGEGHSVYIVDSTNRVIVHRDASLVLRGTVFSVPDHDGIQPGLTGRKTVLVVDTVRFGDQAFSVIAEQEAAQALSLAITTILVTSGLIVAALATSLALGLRVVRQVVRPIQGMAATARAISEGDLSRQVRVANRDEIGVLADAFNSMTSQLTRNMASLERQVMEVKQAEDSLRRVNETLQALFDHSPLAITMLDLDGRIVLWNGAAEKMYGWAAREVLGEALPFVPEDKGESLGAIFAQVARGIIYTDQEFELRRKDGARIFANLSIAPLRDSTGRVYAYMSITIDITERKKVEEEKAKLESQLLHAQKMESVGRLAGGVAHDFNNMLSVILGYAELLKSRLPGEDPLQKYVAELEKAGLRSRDITRQLLAFSRKQIIAPKPVDLNGLIAETQETLARLIGEDIDLSFSPGRDLWRIKFDPSQADQILVNLAVNARDAMPSGGKITIATSNASIDEAYCRERLEASPGHYVVLELSDNGIGMDEETLSHVFEPFFTTKEMGKGTGLGLATVYGIVKQNEGFITIRSEPGLGTTFRVHIPRFMEKAETEEKPEEGPLIPGTGTLLLVEDDVLVRKMTKAMLERLGYRVLVVESPTEALDLFSGPDQSIDLLITDVVMPGMSGPELSKLVKASKPDIKVLFMSGYTSTVIVNRGVLEEGVNFIQKPFGMNDLARKVHEVIMGG